MAVFLEIVSIVNTRVHSDDFYLQLAALGAFLDCLSFLEAMGTD